VIPTKDSKKTNKHEPKETWIKNKQKIKTNKQTTKKIKTNMN